MKFKIDVGPRNWNYGVYELRSFLGFQYWSMVFYTDYFDRAEDHIKRALELPKYYP